MRLHSTRFRALCVIIAAVLVLAQTAPPRALAQPALPPGASAAAATAPAEQQVDPPGRVGRLAAIRGAVSYHEQNGDQWSAAGLNYPIAAGDSFWTQPDASAEMEIGASHVAMNGGTELDVGALDDSGWQATMPQGEVYLHTEELGPNESWSVQTPRGLVMLTGSGRYDIAAGDTQTPTTVTVLDGSVQVSGPGVEQRVGPGQTATITGTQTFAASVGPAQPDPFLTAMVAADRPPSRGVAPASVAQMPGGVDLAAYGTWSQAPDYGEIWYPNVAPGWVPYRDGYWAYVAPWGWTWIDDEPWGFAPMHYGRWVEIDGRWAWTPGVFEAAGPPIYAPALVSFFDIGVGVGAGVGIGAALAEGSIGWCPLGPREPFHPWYHASDRYWRALNLHQVNNITEINRNLTVRDFINRRAMTVVPASALAASRRIGRLASHVDARALGAAHPLSGRDPVRPTAETAGVTPRLARQMHLVAGPDVRHMAAPGPASGPWAAAGGRPLLRGPVERATRSLPGMPAAGPPKPASFAIHPTPEAHLPPLRAAGANEAPPPFRPGVTPPHVPRGVHPGSSWSVTAGSHPIIERPRPARTMTMPGRTPHFAPPPRPAFRALAPRPAFHSAAPRPAFHAPAPRPAPHPASHGSGRRP